MFKSRTTSQADKKSSNSNTSFLGVQAKLNIGKSDDKYEREADAVADKVVNKQGIFGNESFIPPSPAVQKKSEDEQDVQKKEDNEQIQQKSLLNDITPLIQRKPESEVEEIQQKEGEEEVQKKPEEEPVQMTAAPEEDVQTALEEEPIQKQSEEESVQMKTAPEEDIQQKEEEESVQTKQEEELQKLPEDEPLQKMSETEDEVQKAVGEDTIQSKSDDIVQRKLDGDRVANQQIQLKEEEIQEKEEEVQEKELDLQRQSMASGGDQDESIQQKNDGKTGDTSNLESQLKSSKGGGNPMDQNTKSQMESGFGADFSNVRIHNDANAVQMNKDLGAQAFTNGNDIYFNEGKYNPSSKSGQHLLAHELTHTVQQGASNQPNVQKAAAAPVPADAPALKPTVPLDITHRLNITNEWAKYLDAENEKKSGPIEVDVKIGERYSGTIELSRKKGTDDGELAKYEITRGTKKKFLKINGWSFLQPLRDAGVEPVLVLNNFGDEQVTTGFLSVAIKDIAVGNAKGFIDSLNENLDKMGFLGVSPITIADGFVNEFSAGRLVFQVGAMKTLVDGYLEAGGGMGITGDVFTFNVNANIDVAGMAKGEFMIARGEDGSFSGTADIEADIANVNAKLHVEYIDGSVTIQGTGRIESEKFSGEITLLVTDAERSKQMMHAALGVEAMDAEKEQAEAPAAPIPKSKGNQVLAGWGEITANITPWLSGTAKVGIDAEGHVTIVGEITVPQEVELMEQRGKKVDIFKVEIRAGYGIPLVGQVFLFASIGMFMNAGFGPLVLKNVGFKGTYSTDPSVLQEFEITGTLNINAFAVLGLEAEAGVGVTILGHDIKAGVNVTAAAGLRAYAEATPTLQYKEQAAPEGGKMGETRLKGHFEAAAQLFMQLSGSLFYELDSPWWSPAPDGREDFPLGEVQYPIGDSMGIGADMDWLVGSSEIPELKFSPVEFDADKFTADVMADPPPRKMGKAEEEKAGEWEDGNKPGNQQETPETKDGAGLPDTGKAKEDLKKLPDEQKYMRALDEMSKLEKADPKPTFAVVKAKADKVKAKYGLDQIKATDKGDIGEVFVKHAAQDNKKHLLEIPMMSAAERYKLLSAAMIDLRTREKKAVGKDDTIDEESAKAFIAEWTKANPVVEEARVVDGTETWDYFIDIGDKNQTEKGRAKKGEENTQSTIGKEVSFKLGEESHRIWLTFKNGKAVVMMASVEKPLRDQDVIKENKEAAATILASVDSIEKDADALNSEVESGNKTNEEVEKEDGTIESGQDKLAVELASLEGEEIEIDTDFSQAPKIEQTIAAGGITGEFDPKTEHLPAKYTYGYIGNIPMGVGGDNTPENVASLYQREAFSPKEDIRQRFGMVIGVNSFANLDNSNVNAVNSKMKQSSSSFPMGVFGFLWEPNWKKKKDGEQLTFEQVKKKYQDADAEEKALLKAEEDKLMEIYKAKRAYPYGIFRDEVLKHSFTKQLMQDMQKRAENVYIHTGDPDVSSLKAIEIDVLNQSGANALKGVFKQATTGLFNKYDEILAGLGENVVLVSGGYQMLMEEIDLDDTNITATELATFLASELDMEVRQAMAKVDPRTVYFPEPNTLIKVTPLQNSDAVLNASFGKGSGEMRSFIDSLAILKNGGELRYVNARVVTGVVERFIVNVGGHNVSFVLNMQRGILEPNLQTIKSIISKQSQTHAQLKNWGEQVGRPFGINRGKGLLHTKLNDIRRYYQEPLDSIINASHNQLKDKFVARSGSININKETGLPQLTDAEASELLKNVFLDVKLQVEKLPQTGDYTAYIEHFLSQQSSDSGLSESEKLANAEKESQDFIETVNNSARTTIVTIIDFLKDIL